MNVKTKPFRPADQPLFSKYSLSTIAVRSGYSEAYLLRVRAGYVPLGLAFRRKIAAALNELESVLFAETENSDG